MNRAQIIDAIADRALQAEQAVKNNRYVQAAGRDLQGVGSNFKKLIADEADARAKAAQAAQSQAIANDVYKGLVRGNKGVMKNVGEVLDYNPNTVEAVLGGMNKRALAPVARAYEQKTAANLPEYSPRGLYRQANELIAESPGRAIAIGVPAAGAGSLALITASGAALNDLGNFLAGGQQSQDTRDNVLRS